MILQVNLQTHVKNIYDSRFHTSVNVQHVVIELWVRDTNLMIIKIMTQKVKAISFRITFNQLYDFIFYIHQIFLDLVK